MATVQRFEDLKVWQEARALRSELSAIMCGGQFKHEYELRSQILRAALSVMANIAEGFERSTTKEFIQFLFIAKGSNGELRSHLVALLDDKFITEQQYRELCEKCTSISKQLSSFIQYLEQSNTTKRNSYSTPNNKNSSAREETIAYQTEPDTTELSTFNFQPSTPAYDLHK
jgi:four helix bundle protein